MSDQRILIVDDEPALRRSIMRHLRRLGYQLFEAGNGKEAVEQFAQVGPDLVLLDVMMPVMDGVTACETIRTLPGGARAYIIILSAKAEIKDRARGIRAGADTYQTKPFEPTRLIEVVEQGLAIAARTKKATNDPLTGLFNPQYFRPRYQEELARAVRYQQELSMILVHIEALEDINLQHGQVIGDQTQILVAGMIEHQLRKTDMAARLDEGEFVLMLPGTDLAGAELIRSRVEDRVAHYDFVEAGKVTLNWGIASGKTEGENLLSLAAERLEG